jgi:hypothetical protein
MAMAHFADPANLIVEEDELPTIPDNIPLEEIADEVVRGKRTLSRDQMRLLIELLPYYLSKRPTSHHFNFNFAEQLEKELRCIERSGIKPLPAPKVIEAQPVQVSASEMKRPFPTYRNNYRRR